MGLQFGPSIFNYMVIVGKVEKNLIENFMMTNGQFHIRIISSLGRLSCLRNMRGKFQLKRQKKPNIQDLIFEVKTRWPILMR